ncbi:MAG: ADP-L-glycero-D-manno-heptose 6-epimerase [Candidatus Sumerlaeota bacterium]|nr:ADP-L-glycero-D-manno-heptose 6-epimerase [Candidatus Sumerlaeota bacterium]
MIVVTGGAGFIGSALVHRLNQLGAEDILIVDVLGTDDKWRNLNGLVFEDYMERDEFRELVLRGNAFDDINVDWVAHLGACSATTERDAAYLMDNNYAFSQEIAEWALAREARFVYASSAATYGAGEHGYSDVGPISQLRPLNGYAFSKQLFDIWAMRTGALDQCAGIKYFNVFGPNEAHKEDMRSVVCKGFEQIRDTGRIRLFKSDRPEFGDGEQMRDFLYVRDAVAMTIFLLENTTANGLFNAGGGVARTWNDLARAIFAALDKEPVIEYIDMPENLRGKYQYHTQAEIGKIRLAGYTAPITTLEDAVRDYVQNYLVPDLRLGEAG